LRTAQLTPHQSLASSDIKKLSACQKVRKHFTNSCLAFFIYFIYFSELMQFKIHIGTSGWHYAHWRGPFYPAKLQPGKMLSWYAGYFDTVEINNTFYGMPTANALKIWCKETPADFCFAVKASRYITHIRKLKESGEAVEKFLTQMKTLGLRLGPILFQLPPGWQINLQRLEDFLAALPRKHRYVFEFRNPTWNIPKVYDALRRHNAAFCIYELAGFLAPLELTADFTYVRLHGPGDKYQGDYSRSTLRAWAKRIEAWRKELKHIFVYFDNDQAAFAAKNALELKHMVLGTGPRQNQ
jgi:uncharacterized protein YecE (DUF72 family)